MGGASLIVLIIAAIAFSGIAILLSKLIVKPTTNPQKGQAYECGVPTPVSYTHLTLPTKA